MTGQYDDRYVMSHNPDDAESARLALLEANNDPDSRQNLLALGLGTGCRCLEVGSGRGAMARWLADQVGPTGHVVAADINPRFLGAIAGPNLEVRQLNIVTDELETGAFDLVFSRAVLEHLAEYGRALDRMVAALKPGGVIYIEDGDYSGDFARVMASGGKPGEAEHFTRTLRHIMGSLDIRGVHNPHLGRRLSLEFEARGLVDVGNVGVVRVSGPADPMTRFWALTVRHAQPNLVSQGIVSEEDIQRMLRVFEDPAMRWVPITMCCAWGRRRA